MADLSVESSPQLYARTGGALYLALIILGVFAEAVRDSVIVPGNPAATAAAIHAGERLWRLGVVSEFVGLICATALAMIYFVLLRPVSSELNLLATFLRLIAIAVQAVAVLNLDAALSMLVNAASVNALSTAQLDALASLAIRAHSHGWALALLFFGATFLVHGYLIFRSGFLPPVLGILIQVAGLCYLTNSFALFLGPAVAYRIFPFILFPSFIGEASLCLWLLVKGVNVEKWSVANAAFIASLTDAR
jgi:chromate transport protein ChrA